MLALVENRAILEKEADESSADARLLALENETAALRHASHLEGLKTALPISW